MSLSKGGLQSFLGPLVGKTTIFLVDGRDDNLAFARVLATFLAEARTSCAVLDLDALYSSNSDIIFSPMDAATARSTIIRVPEPGSEVELELARLFQVQQKVLVVDSLNSLFHLISIEEGSSRGRKLTFALASLSYFARTSGKAVVITMYKREGLYQAGNARPISSLSDGTASVSVRDQTLEIRGERGASWPAGAFSSRIPSVSPYRYQRRSTR